MNDLLDLRQVAVDADAAARPWTWKGGYPQTVLREGDVVLVAQCFTDPDAPGPVRGVHLDVRPAHGAAAAGSSADGDKRPWITGPTAEGACGHRFVMPRSPAVEGRGATDG